MPIFMWVLQQLELKLLLASETHPLNSAAFSGLSGEDAPNSVKTRCTRIGRYGEGEAFFLKRRERIWEELCDGRRRKAHTFKI